MNHRGKDEMVNPMFRHGFLDLSVGRVVIGISIESARNCLLVVAPIASTVSRANIYIKG